MQSVHKPVLLHEVTSHLTDYWSQINSRQTSISGEKTITVVDGTLGGAGHSLEICGFFHERINLIGLDRDPKATEQAAKTLSGKANKIILECENFRNIDKVLNKYGIQNIDFIILDLGISSDELQSSGKGFSFQKDEELLMTMGDPASYPFNAKTIVNEWSEETIADVIFGYGEERFARRISRAIISYRAKKKIETSGELSEIVKSSVPAFYRRGKIHPATKTFQALRIAVNDELGALKEGLAKGYEFLNYGGRMAIISFHSLEDRIVKNFYKEKAKDGALIVTKKPIRPSNEEVAINPRSRSAKLRILEK